MDKKILGQPVWLWAAGAAVVVGGYLYFRHKAAATAAGKGGAGGAGGATGHASPTGWDNATFTRWVTEWQGPPRRKPQRKG